MKEIPFLSGRDRKMSMVNIRISEVGGLRQDAGCLIFKLL
jgi:hypothetical protein